MDNSGSKIKERASEFIRIIKSNPKLAAASVGGPLLIIGILLLVFFVIWIYKLLTLDKKNCSKMNKMYSEFPLIASFNPNIDDFSYNLRDYYVRTAYNCCAPGNYKNTFVN